MNKKLSTDSRGIAHLAIIIVVVLVLAIGGVGYLVYSKTKKGVQNAVTNAVSQAVSQAQCDYDDKDLCKFFASWKDQKYFKAATESQTEGVKSTGTFAMINPDKSHIVSSSPAMEMITIGDTTYTKDQTDGKWVKFTFKSTETDNLSDYTFEEPKKDVAAEQQTQYKSLGKEACGKLECFKYQVIDPKYKDTTEYIWFDTKDYQLRRQRSEEKNGDYYDSTITYEKVEISEPSPIKEGGASILPTPSTSTPMDGPSEADMERIMLETEGGMDGMTE